jgi:hydantoinase/carbamoylase family amidase
MLSQIGNLGSNREDGFLRAGWSNEESEAFAYIKKCAEEKGFCAEEDAVGNLYLRVAASGTDQVVQVGSHLDTVPAGGLFDGGAGIVAGLEAISAVLESKKELAVGMELVVWRSEESATWKSVCIGSRAALGINPPEILNNIFGGKMLEEAIKAQGYDPSPIQEQRPALSKDRQKQIRAHLELHIEQSVKLEVTGTDIGVVSSIRGTRRKRIIVRGEAAHSGGTPMGKKYRSDANLAIAYMQTRLDASCQEEIGKGNDLVQTVGVLNSDQNYNQTHQEIYSNAITKVSPIGYFSLDFRSNNVDFLNSYERQAKQIIEETAKEFGVEVQIEALTQMDPLESLDSKIHKMAIEVSQKYGYSAISLPSGALHDAAILGSHIREDGTVIPIGMLFIPCRKGISHNPLEYASSLAIKKGSEVLAGILEEVCCKE